MKRVITLVGFMWLAVTLVACGESGTSAHPAEQTVVKYLEARISGNEDGIKSQLCASQEAEAPKLAQSFKSVQAKLENVVCKFDSTAKTVACEGAIVVTYQGENRNLAPGKYNMTEEDGVWKVCGEAR